MQVNGTKIRELREEKNIRHAELAVVADLGERRIQQIEQGEIVNLNLNIARAIAKRLGCNLEVIAKG